MTTIDCKKCGATCADASEMALHNTLYHSGDKSEYSAPIQTSKGNVKTIAPLTQKQCNRCGQSKGISHFGRHARTKDGYQPACRECISIAMKSGWDAKKKQYTGKPTITTASLAAEAMRSSGQSAREQLVKDLSKQLDQKPEPSSTIYCPDCHTVWSCEYAKLLRCPAGCTNQVLIVKAFKKLKVETIEGI